MTINGHNVGATAVKYHLLKCVINIPSMLSCSATPWAFTRIRLIPMKGKGWGVSVPRGKQTLRDRPICLMALSPLSLCAGIRKQQSRSNLSGIFLLLWAYSLHPRKCLVQNNIDDSALTLCSIFCPFSIFNSELCFFFTFVYMCLSEGIHKQQSRSYFSAIFSCLKVTISLSAMHGQVRQQSRYSQNSFILCLFHFYVKVYFLHKCTTVHEQKIKLNQIFKLFFTFYFCLAAAHKNKKKQIYVSLYLTYVSLLFHLNNMCYIFSVWT